MTGTTPTEALRHEQMRIARRMMWQDPQRRGYWREMYRKAKRKAKGGGR